MHLVLLIVIWTTVQSSHVRESINQILLVSDLCAKIQALGLRVGFTLQKVTMSRESLEIIFLLLTCGSCTRAIGPVVPER